MKNINEVIQDALKEINFKEACKAHLQVFLPERLKEKLK